MTKLEIFDAKAVAEALSRLSKQWKERKYVQHFDARTIDNAVSLLSQYREEAKIIAGGVDLISLMKNKVMLPDVLVNIKTIPGLANIAGGVEGLRMGTVATIHDIEKSAIIKNHYSMIAEAAHLVASPQIRNMATLGGNLCQNVNCWYYRREMSTGSTFHCRRKGGTICYAVDGDSRYHAIIDGKECFAVCASDMATALVALDAKIKIAGPICERLVKIEEFYRPLGNILKPNELITELQVSAIKPGTKQRYLKFRLRKAIDFAILSVASVITTEAGIVTDARIVLGGVAPMPYRAFGAEEAIIGKVINESLAEMSAKAAVKEAAPLSGNAYKVPIAEALIKRALLS